MRLPGWTTLALLGATAIPVAAQQRSSTPVRFGVAWTHGVAQGEFGTISENPNGFTAWVSLPINRHSAFGLRAEFSILTFPDQALHLADETTGDAVDFAVRSTVGFTGAGPRVEFRRGRLVATGGVMGGFVRLINDVSARTEFDGQQRSAVLSLSEYVWAAKVTGEVHWSVYRGHHGDGVGIVVGADWGTGGDLPFPVRETLRVAQDGVVQVNTRVIAPNLLALRAGIGVEF